MEIQELASKLERVVELAHDRHGVDGWAVFARNHCRPLTDEDVATLEATDGAETIDRETWVRLAAWEIDVSGLVAAVAPMSDAAVLVVADIALADEADRLAELEAIGGADAASEAIGHDCREMMRGIAEPRRRLALRAEKDNLADEKDPEKVGAEIERRLKELSRLIQENPETMGYAWLGRVRGEGIRKGINQAVRALGYGTKSAYYIRKVH